MCAADGCRLRGERLHGVRGPRRRERAGGKQHLPSERERGHEGALEVPGVQRTDADASETAGRRDDTARFAIYEGCTYLELREWRHAVRQLRFGAPAQRAVEQSFEAERGKLRF